MFVCVIVWIKKEGQVAAACWPQNTTPALRDMPSHFSRWVKSQTRLANTWVLTAPQAQSVPHLQLVEPDQLMEAGHSSQAIPCLLLGECWLLGQNI